MRVPLLSLKRAVRLPLAGEFFETNPKMVLINDDQWIIADIVLDVWLFEKKLITLVITIVMSADFCTIKRPLRSVFQFQFEKPFLKKQKEGSKVHKFISK